MKISNLDLIIMFDALRGSLRVGGGQQYAFGYSIKSREEAQQRIAKELHAKQLDVVETECTK